MRTSPELVPALLLAALLAPLSAQTTATEPVDQAAVDFLKTEGLENSQVMEHLSWICDVYGPRLTGSPNLRQAQEWAKGTFEEWGLQNAQFHDWGPFGEGWRLDRFSMHVVGDNPWLIHAYPKAWSSSLDGVVTADIVPAYRIDAEELASMDLSNKIVMLEEPRELTEWFEGTAHRFDAEERAAMADGTPMPQRGPARAGGDWRAGFQKRQAIEAALADNRPLAILDRGYKGDQGTLFVTSASATNPPGTPRDERARAWTPGADVVPQITLAVEHYNRICRMLDKGRPVTVEVELATTRFTDGDGMQRNVLADLPGTDPELKDQLVMLGAHFDSWHTGTGATDNGCGSAVMMEAIRLLKAYCDSAGVSPRRTIRVALWSGEEQGLLGSRAWVADHVATPGERGAPPAAIHDLWHQLSGYFNLDNGTGRVRGVYLQGNERVAPIFREWLKPFHELDATTITLSDTGGTDHLAFDRVGLPGFQFIQDPIAYSTRTHHSNYDVWDHAVAEDLQQAATVIASFVWHTAMRDEKLPRVGVDIATAEAAAGRR